MTPSSLNSRPNRKKYLVLMPVLAVVLIDQYVKHLIRTGFSVGESLRVIENVFYITYVQNTGAAFSMFRNMPVMTVLLPAVLSIACAVMAWRMYRRGELLLTAGLELVLAGGVGNLIDRLSLGYVVDMFDFRIWPVFNVADIAVVTGCCLVMIWALFVDGKREKKNV